MKININGSVPDRLSLNPGDLFVWKAGLFVVTKIKDTSVEAVVIKQSGDYGTEPGEGTLFSLADPAICPVQTLTVDL